MMPSGTYPASVLFIAVPLRGLRECAPQSRGAILARALILAFIRALWTQELKSTQQSASARHPGADKKKTYTGFAQSSEHDSRPARRSASPRVFAPAPPAAVRTPRGRTKRMTIDRCRHRKYFVAKLDVGQSIWRQSLMTRLQAFPTPDGFYLPWRNSFAAARA